MKPNAENPMVQAQQRLQLLTGAASDVVLLSNIAHAVIRGKVNITDERRLRLGISLLKAAVREWEFALVPPPSAQASALSLRLSE